MTCSNVLFVDYQPDGQAPVAPSAVAIGNGQVFAIKQGKMVDYPVPRALELDEIPHITSMAVQGARNAINAGAERLKKSPSCIIQLDAGHVNAVFTYFWALTFQAADSILFWWK